MCPILPPWSTPSMLNIKILNCFFTMAITITITLLYCLGFFNLIIIFCYFTITRLVLFVVNLYSNYTIYYYLIIKPILFSMKTKNTN